MENIYKKNKIKKIVYYNIIYKYLLKIIVNFTFKEILVSIFPIRPKKRLCKFKTNNFYGFKIFK